MDAERLKQRILVRKLGTEEDLKPRKLSIDDWRGMNAEMQEWHIATNSRNVDAMLNSEAAAKQQAQQNEINARAWDAKRFHERSLGRTLSAEEKAAAGEQAQLFSARVCAKAIKQRCRHGLADGKKSAFRVSIHRAGI